MYLKSVTLRGFKSFASATTLHLEPGITCIVGPNGSGKSNVVDALAWVMGEQGAKTLRGSKMEDVIFAGTTGRAPLGRAEVSLTIDNSDGALPIDYSEVTITRTMFRNGGSEYSINGAKARLVDVQDLLSDSGIGRAMHVIVGQGQLDAILHASPEERRGFVEEAAGVLKHRKRKEKALRKLDSTQGNLDRLADLITEIRRQLKPLGRQAEVARRAAVVQAEARDAKARLAADDLVQARTTLERELADESVLIQRRSTVEAELAQNKELEAALDQALAQSRPALSAAQESWFALSGLTERVKGTRSLAQERVRNARSRPDEQATGRDPDRLDAEAAEAAAAESEAAAQTELLRAGLEAAVNARKAAEDEVAAEERRVTAEQRAAADAREALARLQGQVNTLRARLTAADDEVNRLVTTREEALARATASLEARLALESQAVALDAGEQGLDSAHESAVEALDEIDAAVAEIREEASALDRARSALAARRDALALGLQRKDGAAALQNEATKNEPDAKALVSLADLVHVAPGHDTAIAAALGRSADALVVADLTAAAEALRRLRDGDLGQATLAVAPLAVSADPSTTVMSSGAEEQAASAAVPALAVVSAPAALHAALRELLADVVIVEDLDAALGHLASAVPAASGRPCVAVTRAGDLVTPHWVSGGSSAAPSMLELRTAHDEAVAELARVIERSQVVGSLLIEREAARQLAVNEFDDTLARLHDSDAQMAAVAEELADLSSRERTATSEAERLQRSIDQARTQQSRTLDELNALEERLAATAQTPTAEVDTQRRAALSAAATQARQVEMEARLALRTSEERARATHGRADSLRRQATSERDRRAKARARREHLERQAVTAQAVERACGILLERLELSVVAAGEERTAIEGARAQGEEQLRATRSRTAELTAELEALVSSAHRDQLARAQHQMRIEQLEARVLEGLGLAPDVLVAEYGPDVPIPVRATADASPGASSDAVAGSGAPADLEAPVVTTTAYVRAEQERRLQAAERDLAQLGRINPLALEEFDAMEERHQFLTTQLEDLKQTRRDLLDIVKEVDARVEQVFTQAYQDVVHAFDDAFTRLFPGGEGRLVLTDPSDMLSTGIEIEARPAGKKVKKLSLLSGGERSLVAVAFLVALFKARPSPFYILDEVEAALDDTNLGRLLQIYEELREDSQLLVITHQKRTMEVGDALYGVTMRGDGVSTVISQRLKEPVNP